MRRMLLVASMVLIPALAGAQTNTTGTILPNTTAQVTPGAGAPTTGQTATTPGATTAGPAAPPTAPTAPTPSTTAAAPRDAAIVVCGEDISTGVTRLVVFSSSTSTGGPTIAPASPCAQALADLFVAGFGVIDVQPFNQQLQYTLVR